jgi:PAS domain S-box-containing protein
MFTEAGTTVFRKSMRLFAVVAAICAAIAGLVLGFIALRADRGVALASIAVLATLAGVALAVYRRASAHAFERSYRNFFDHAIDGIFRTTPDGHYLEANAALAHIYGYESPRALMAGLTDIGGQLYLEPGRREDFLTEMQAHGKVVGFISRIRRHDGSLIWISENARAVRNSKGRIIFYEGTVEDVTAKLETAAALKRALRESEEANRAKSAFLAAMSHELKTPLNAVLGFSEILKSEMLGPIGQAAYRDYASDIHASGARLLSIINDILDTARLQGGAITLASRPISLLELTESAVALARRSTQGTHAVTFDLPSDAPLVDVDPVRLGQALSNLVSNALKFTPESGTITVGARLVANDAISITVSDTGIGMDADKIAAALEPFRQLDGSLARRFEGTGLGLSIAKALVELHGGTLSVKSVPGEGTVVTLALPAARVCWRALAATG